ncbi:MAG: penicillin-binding transpeptidase domain-containing protein, partial [Alphaproteobacteria bacterium]|nr:penicillin-binding transpeptidase domain-containing protein [Alphaproteobacteria bacterium]
MFEVGKDIAKIVSRARMKQLRGRLCIVNRVFAVAFFVFASYTVYLGTIGTEAHRRGTGAGEWVSVRAPIVDRHGVILAQNIMSGHIVLRPWQVQDNEVMAHVINEIIPSISVQNARAHLNSGRRFITLARFASESQIAEVRARRLPGLSTDASEQRRYPQRRLFSHIVGFVGSDMIGQEGVERTSNRYLSTNTAPLVLSLDARIQSVMYAELLRAKNTFSAIGAMGIIMNAQNGEIISAVAIPDFDPEDSTGRTANIMFPITQGIYEMGSVFKTFTLAMALENGMSIDTEYNISRPFQIRDRRGRVAATINDHTALRRRALTYITIADMLHLSSNIAASQMMLDIPVPVMTGFFERLHFNRRLELDFGTTAMPQMPPVWGPVERATAAFGQGPAITPIHKLLAF